MPKRWQKAINHWDDWRDSVTSTRTTLLKEYCDLDYLEDRTLELSYQADKGALPQSLMPEYRKVSLDMWNIYNEVEVIGVKFIQDNLGLPVGGWLNPLLQYYTQSVIPELTKGCDD